MGSILIVEDDPVSQRLLGSSLEHQGHQTTACAGADEAWELLNRLCFVDAVILDNHLAGEFGWEFLRKVRADPFFRKVPVVVCMANTDRSTVMKYLELGVQAVLLKPYEAESFDREVATALAADWSSALFEQPERVCGRLKLPIDDYYRTLTTAAEEVRERGEALVRLAGTARRREASAHVEAVHSTAATLGVTALAEVTGNFRTALKENEPSQQVRLAKRYLATAKLMQQRSLRHFGLASQGADLLGHPGRKGAARKPAAPAAKPVPPRETGGPAEVAGAGLTEFVDDLRRVAGAGLIDPAELLKTIARPPARGPLGQMAASLRDLFSADDWDNDALLEHVRSLPGLEDRFIALGARGSARQRRSAAPEKDNGRGNGKGRGEDGPGPIDHNHPEDLGLTLQRFGHRRSACIAAAYRWVTIAQKARNPLDLKPLAAHALGVALLAHELSLKLKGADNFVLAGLLHDIGKWFLALQHPGFTGIALTLGQAGAADLRRAQKEIFGLDHHELAEAALGAWETPAWAAGAARHHADPAAARGTPAAVTAAIVQLADTLARNNQIGYDGPPDPDPQDAFINAPAWSCLQDAGVSFSLEPAAFHGAFSAVVDLVKWQVETVLG